MHPDFKTMNGELHHKRRYKNKITISWHLYGENITQKEKETAQNIVVANAVNYDGKVNRVCFYESAEKNHGGNIMIALINGSPKYENSSSKILLNRFENIQTNNPKEIQKIHLLKMKFLR